MRPSICFIYRRTVARRPALWAQCAVSAIVAAGSFLAPGYALAQSAIMIEAGDQALRDDIQWLIDRRVFDLTASTWPMPLSALENAMQNSRKTGLSQGDKHALSSIQMYLDRQHRTTLGITAQLNSDSIPQLGFASQARAKAGLGAYAQASTDGFAGKVQVNGLVDPITSKQSHGNLEGSYVAATGLGQTLYFGQLAHFWGPGQDGSLNWGNAGTAIPGIGLQRAKQTAFESKWLSWIGPWGYDLFVGQLQHDTAVPDAQVMNMRLFIRPIEGLELGASRFIEFGGKGRKRNLGAFWDALTGNSNVDDISQDPSNELAGFDARYTFLLGENPLTLYTQLAGEDEAGGLPSRYLAQLGAQFKHMAGASRVQWHAEASDTTARRLFGLKEGLKGYAYNHGVYRDGLYHDGLPIGHPLGGDGQLLSAGVSVVPTDSRYSSRYSAKLMHATINLDESINMAFPRADKWVGGEFAYSWVMRPATFRAGFTVLHSTKGSLNDAFSLMLSVNVPLGIPR
jgi:hypothetical protein